jgi:hypothetical protein
MVGGATTHSDSRIQLRFDRKNESPTITVKIVVNAADNKQYWQK